LGMALDAPQENEEIFKVDSFEILVNDDAKPYASSNVLDYINTVEGEGFILQPESGQCC